LPDNHHLIRGLSCDGEGVFLAGDVPLIYRRGRASSGAVAERHLAFPTRLVRDANSKGY